MLTRAEAIQLVSERLRQMSSPDDVLIVVDEGTIEREFGWVLFYNSRKFIETGDYRFQLAGNGPVMVNKDDGSIEFCGASKSVEAQIREYERRLAEK